MEQMLTIGEFATRCGLSRSALRFYDQNGLLKPSDVNAESGYRYYSPDQIEQALLVRRLRTAEMSVGAVRDYLASGPDRRREMLAAHSAAFRRRAGAVAAAVAELTHDLDIDSAVQTEAWCSLPAAELAAALEQVRFACAEPAERPELSGVWVETREDSLRLVTTDSYRLAVRDLVPERLGRNPLRGLLGSDRLPELCSLLTGAQTAVIAQDGTGNITIGIDGRTVQAGSLTDDFPDYETLLAGVPSGEQVAVARDQLQSALAELDRDDTELSLSFESGSLRLHAGGTTAAVAGSWPGAPLTLVINARFLGEAVDATVGPDVLIEAADALTPITLRSADTGTFSVLTMPIRSTSCA